MDIFLLYLFTRVDQIKSLLEVFTVIGGMASAILLIIYTVATICSSDDAGARKTADAVRTPKNWALSLWAMIMVGGLLLPSQKDLALIVGGKLAIEATQSPTAKKVYAIVDDMLDEQLAKIAKKNERKEKQ